MSEGKKDENEESLNSHIKKKESVYNCYVKRMDDVPDMVKIR